MKNKKGFTLIELLAVIVILAILMVIAIPRILNVIESSRNSAAFSSIKLLKDSIKTQIASSELSNIKFTKDNDNCYIFDFNLDTNGNVNKLSLKNKENFSGITKYCDGSFTDTNLTFQGNNGVDEDENKVYIIKNGRFVENEYGIDGFIENYQTDSFGELNVTLENGYIQVAQSGQRNSYNCKAVKFNKTLNSYNNIVIDGEINRLNCPSSRVIHVLDAVVSDSCIFEKQNFVGKLMEDTDEYSNNSVIYDCFGSSHTNVLKIYNLYIEKE